MLTQFCHRKDLADLFGTPDWPQKPPSAFLLFCGSVFGAEERRLACAHSVFRSDHDDGGHGPAEAITQDVEGVKQPLRKNTYQADNSLLTAIIMQGRCTRSIFFPTLGEENASQEIITIHVVGEKWKGPTDSRCRSTTGFARPS